MAEFFAELKRRQIYRVGAAYVVVAWALAQGVGLLSQIFALPSWIAQPVVILLVIGFPVALVATWVIESKPHEAVASSVKSKPTIVDWTLVGALAVVLLFMGYRQLVPAPDATIRQAGVEAARSAASSTAGAISIAVLPFANLSGDPSQEFFSDGITEEITSALARVPDLRVVARTSAYQFRDQNRDIQSIGQQLHATHFIEGSVRKAGDRVRITAQLIKADDGTHIWTDNFDRDLTDIFAIQEDIARAIATSLRMPLGLAPGDSLVRGTQNVGIYQDYLQAKTWYRDRTVLGRGPFLEILESVVARDPGFAPAWATLSRAYLFMTNREPKVEAGTAEEARRIVQSIQEKAENAAKKAIELDPRHASGYAALASIRVQQGQWAEAEDLIKQALMLDPNDPEALNTYNLPLLMRTGRPKEALDVSEQLRALEPLVPIYDTNSAMIMQVLGDNDGAIRILESIPANTRSILGYFYLARAYAAAGRYADGADALLKGAGAFADRAPASGRKGIEDAAAVLRTAPAVAANPKALPDFGDWRGELIFVYAAVGAFDRAMEHPEREAQTHNLTDFGKTMWSAVMAPARKTERFKRFVRDAGLIGYWRERGWPEFCKPVGADDFACS